MSRPARNVLAPVLTAGVLVALCGSMALQAKSAAEDFLPSINVSTPPLIEFEPLHNTPPTRLSRRVILYVVDGLRLSDSFGKPALDDLRRRGIDAVALSHYPTISRPNHVTLLTGVPPELSGVRNNFYNATVGLDSLMDRASATDLSSAYVADYAAGVAYMFRGDFDDVHYGRWPGALVNGARVSLEREYPLVVIIDGLVDEAGHLFGADSDEYRGATVQAGHNLAAVVDAIDLDLDTLIVTADHGHLDGGGHGGNEPEVTEVPLILAGAGIRRTASLGEVHLADVAPTIAALLGMSAPGHSVGRTLTEALILDDDTASKLQTADGVRRFRNKAIAASAAEAERPAIAARQVRRLALVIVLAAFAVILLVAMKRMGALKIDWRVLVIAVPAFPVTYYALLNLLGASLSLSAIPDRGEALDRLFDFGLISTGVYAIAGWLALQGRVVLRNRLAAANALSLCGIFVAWLPAGILWALYGGGPYLELPGSTVLVLVPSTYVAVATYAIGVSVVLGLEIVIFFARAIDPRVRLRRLERAAASERRRLETDST